MKWLARNLAASLDYEKSAQNSFRHFHAKGLTYVNLLRTTDLSVKLYITEPGTKHNDQGYLVNPHTHRYNFFTHVLEGWMENVMFDQIPHRGGSPVEEWWHFNYCTPLAGEEGAGFTRLGLEFMSPVSTQQLHAGGSYYLDCSQIHTIRVAPDTRTVLLLAQFRDVQQNTAFYSKDPVEPSMVGLYERMSADEVRHIVRGLL